jgi:outer membrane protein TolC
LPEPGVSQSCATLDLPGRPPAELLQGPLSLQLAVEIAMANNPDLSAMEWDYQAASARYQQSSGDQAPRFSIVGGYAHHVDYQRLLPIHQPGDHTIVSRDIVSSDIFLIMPIFTGGRIVNQIKAAELL